MTEHCDLTMQLCDTSGQRGKRRVAMNYYALARRSSTKHSTQRSALTRLVHGNGISMGIPWVTSHGMGRDRHKLLWDGNGTDKYVPWTTLALTLKYWQNTSYQLGFTRSWHEREYGAFLPLPGYVPSNSDWSPYCRGGKPATRKQIQTVWTWLVYQNFCHPR